MASFICAVVTGKVVNPPNDSFPEVLNMILKSPPMVFLSFEVTEQMTAEMGTVPRVQNGCYINIISTITSHNNNILI